MKTKRLIPIALCMTLVLAACGGEEGSTSTTSAERAATTTTVAEATTTSTATTTAATGGRTFVGADGVETTITDTSRIVSLNGDITEIIYELGLGDDVVAVDVTTTYPEEAAALNDSGSTVGFAQQLTAEAVLSFEPTLVIGDTQVAPVEAIEQLREAGVPVVIIEYQTTLDGVEAKIDQISEVLGVDEQGAQLAERVMGEIDDAVTTAESVADKPRVAFIYLRGPQVIFLFGAGMPTQAMIEGAGAVDAGAESGVLGPAPLTPEALIAAAPDVIVLPQGGLEAMGGVEAFEAIPGVSDTPAADTQRYLIYDEAYFFNLGPRTGQALMGFVQDLHPELAG
ncbi:MAG: ABC transporter substrate-binding protein [Acidimicrobiia bacterium]